MYLILPVHSDARTDGTFVSNVANSKVMFKQRAVNDIVSLVISCFSYPF
jgi:hypothetical protein